MRELQVIVEAWEKLEQNGTRAALATIVKVEGSAYRRAGARMLIAEDGRSWGGISGGCLEADVVLRAQQVIQTNQPDVACYDTRSDADLYFGLGLGCNGVIRILIEPLPDNTPQLTFFRDFVEGREPATLANVFHSSDATIPISAHYLLHSAGHAACNISQQRLSAIIRHDLCEVLSSGRSTAKTYTSSGGEVEVFLEVLQPPPALVIFGAGHDAVPVVEGAKALGWHVTIADHRPSCATTEHFPSADEIMLASVRSSLEQVSLDSHTCALLMTHNYLHDLEILPTLLQSPVRYIGVLGAQRRINRLLSDLEKEGWEFTEEQLARFHGPVGLDIGAETPAEIALSILAEMQAALKGRDGHSLRERRAPIHAIA